MRSIAAVVIVVGSLAAAGACGSVPDVRFVEDARDGSADVGDGASRDGSDAREAAAEPRCPDVRPPGTNGCCATADGSVPCIGGNCENQCSKCADCRSADEYCCTQGPKACIAASSTATCQ